MVEELEAVSLLKYSYSNYGLVGELEAFTDVCDLALEPICLGGRYRRVTKFLRAEFGKIPIKVEAVVL